MESVLEVIKHVFLGASCAVEDGDLLREHNITHLLGISNCHNLKEKRAKQIGGFILGSKSVHVKDSILEVVEASNDYIHFCRKNGFNVLVHSPRSLPLSSLLIALYLRTVSDCVLDDTVRLLRQFRPEHDFKTYRRELALFGSRRGPCEAERARLGEVWGERQPALSWFDYAMLTQLQIESRRMISRRHHQLEDTHDSIDDQLLTWKSLDEYRRSLLVDKTVKEETMRREMKERRREEKYQMTYAPDYKLTYDCHEFDESIFHNARLVDFYLPSSIYSMLTSQHSVRLPNLGNNYLAYLGSQH